jgi:cytoskeletal protein RodZ
MALSMDEQRILAEIERRLAADDPRLASSLASFRRPGPGTALRSPRARVLGSLFTVLLVAVVSLMVYAMIPFRAHGVRTSATPSAGFPGRATISATGDTNQQNGTQRASASASVTSTVRSSTTRGAGSSPTAVSPKASSGKAAGASASAGASQAADQSTSPGSGP